MIFDGSFCDLSSILMAVGGFILFYALLFTTNNINFYSFCIIETRAKPRNPTSIMLFTSQDFGLGGIRTFICDAHD